MSNEAIDWAIKQSVSGDDGRSSAARKLILLLLANRADDSWVCWPSRKLLAQEAGITPRQVSKHLEALETAKLIRRGEWERADGGQGANVYVLGGDADTPLSCTTRGGGRIRPGGWSKTTRPGGPQRQALNPKENTTTKPSDFAAREESRRRSSAKAAEAHTVTEDQLFDAIDVLAFRSPAEKLEQYVEVIKSRAPKLWRDSHDAAAKQYANEENAKPRSTREVEYLACKYVVRKRKGSWASWLSGPLLPYVPEAKEG